MDVTTLFIRHGNFFASFTLPSSFCLLPSSFFSPPQPLFPPSQTDHYGIITKSAAHPPSAQSSLSHNTRPFVTRPATLHVRRPHKGDAQGTGYSVVSPPLCHIAARHTHVMVVVFSPCVAVVLNGAAEASGWAGVDGDTRCV